MEGASGAVEFLSVECDMIFEPECDLETEYQEEGEEDGAASPLCRTPSPSAPEPHTPPSVGELFRGRSVGVYHRSDPNDPFVLIYDPSLETPTVEDIKEVGGGDGEWNSPKEDREEVRCDREDQGLQCRQSARCSVCRKQFSSRGRLVTHSLTHLVPSPGPPPPCPVCGAVLPSRAALKIHVRCHFSSQTYQCPGCQQCHLTRTQLMIHQQLHGSPRHHRHHHHNQAASTHTPASAPVQCKAQEETSGQLECRMKVPVPQEKSHPPQPHCCDRCDATFTTRLALHSHRKSHREHRRRRRRRHECPECGSQFWRSSALKKHRRAEHDV